MINMLAERSRVIGRELEEQELEGIAGLDRYHAARVVVGLERDRDREVGGVQFGAGLDVVLDVLG